MTTSEHAHDSGLAHIASAKSLVLVFSALVVLTVVTVLAADLNLGNVDLVVAMTIATVKATLVALFFMHLRYERTFNIVIFLSSIVFVSVFISFCLVDSHQYEATVDWIQTLKIK